MPTLTAEQHQVLAEYRKLRRIWRGKPDLYARQRLGLTPTDQQRRALRAMATPGARVSARAGHNVGKTAFTAATIWWFLECFDYAKVPCTAPSRHQLETVLWAELAKWQRRSDQVCRKAGVPEALLLSSMFDLQATSIRDRGAPKEWFAVARTSRKETPDALQGFHASNIEIVDGQAVERGDPQGGGLLFVIEEASGVPDAIFEVVEGALASAGSRQLMIGNPVRNSGYFADSHKKNRAAFTVFHFRCDDSPLVDPAYRAGLVRKYGEGSNVVRVRADGEFPKQDDDVLIPLELAEACLEREDDRPATGPRRLGIDPARFGIDRTVFTLRHGHRVERIHIAAKLDTQQTAGLGKVLASQWEAEEIYVDEIGIGAGVVDRLREEVELPVVGVNVAAAAPPRAAGQETPRLLRDHLWLEMRDWLRDEAPVFAVPADEQEAAQDLAGELSLPKYGFDGSGRLVVESKEDMKKRLTSAGSPGRSPDIADSLGVTFAPDTRPSTGALQVSF